MRPSEGAIKGTKNGQVKTRISAPDKIKEVVQQIKLRQPLFYLPLASLHKVSRRKSHPYGELKSSAKIIF
jgi:hypothetical protein